MPTVRTPEGKLARISAAEVLRGPIKSKTIFPALLLHMLAQGPDHGYGLMQRIEKLTGDLLPVNTNTIYPLLRRLEERGFVKGGWDHPSKRARRIYEITDSGRERLASIKSNMLPYLDMILGAINKLKGELYPENAPQTNAHGKAMTR
ncbi:MAG TPA: PadR family transcriptional regulator [Candidatus Dormibacteraeota bacterium]|nr:PadR family transcriptional regulator [Candidatus Dormibacteraeota bacterium]